MNINKTIREQRNKLSLSQEVLAEKLYVTRQTIGNWENNKSYPDIHSLILLSQIFDMTIDNLIKGDLKIMEQIIEKNDIRIYKKYYTVELIGFIVGPVLLLVSWWKYPFFMPGVLIGLLIFVAGIYCSIKADQIKKRYDIATFKEIVAFAKGETLDEISKVRESGKRMYQIGLSAIGWGAYTVIAAKAIHWILKYFSG